MLLWWFFPHPSVRRTQRNGKFASFSTHRFTLISPWHLALAFPVCRPTARSHCLVFAYRVQKTQTSVSSDWQKITAGWWQPAAGENNGKSACRVMACFFAVCNQKPEKREKLSIKWILIMKLCVKSSRHNTTNHFSENSSPLAMLAGSRLAVQLWRRLDWRLTAWMATESKREKTRDWHAPFHGLRLHAHHYTARRTHWLSVFCVLVRLAGWTWTARGFVCIRVGVGASKGRVEQSRRERAHRVLPQMIAAVSDERRNSPNAKISCCRWSVVIVAAAVVVLVVVVGRRFQCFSRTTVDNFSLFTEKKLYDWFVQARAPLGESVKSVIAVDSKSPVETSLFLTGGQTRLQANVHACGVGVCVRGCHSCRSNPFSCKDIGNTYGPFRFVVQWLNGRESVHPWICSG